MTNNELYEDFQKSSETQKPMMTHKPSDIRLAKRFYKGYLAEEELCERQYTGRFWSIEKYMITGYALYIIIDNNTFMVVVYYGNTITEDIYDMSQTCILPENLRGYFYYDD